VPDGVDAVGDALGQTLESMGGVEPEDSIASQQAKRLCVGRSGGARRVFHETPRSDRGEEYRDRKLSPKLGRWLSNILNGNNERSRIASLERLWQPERSSVPANQWLIGETISLFVEYTFKCLMDAVNLFDLAQTVTSSPPALPTSAPNVLTCAASAIRLGRDFEPMFRAEIG
jgi:hypothetical protein